ncbi:MAG: adenylate kinase [Candidatus Omnitrophota bacterium]|jgi:adenylate kinase|nr:adenylate kinase [Candidatus Omnitrophota bacterium]
MRLVLLGPPGAGKGTLAGSLKDSLTIEHISMGDILREEMKNNTALGKQAKMYIDRGELLPDEVVTKIIEQKLKKPISGQCGFLLDGFPRTVQQAKDLDAILRKIKNPLDYVLYLKATLPVIIQRLTGRRVCRNCGAVFHATNRPPKKPGICNECGGPLYQRADDNEETIRTRMDVYTHSTQPIIEYYESQDKLLPLDADKESEYLAVMLNEKFNENG